MKKEQTQKAIVKRAPVVIVMGHIVHGKSTLLDYIRKSNTVDKEKGGITQHIGAYEAIFTDKTSTEHRLTFIDTPGHAAFCSIREHGSKAARSEEHTSELQSHVNLVCRLLLEKI